jgi:hypothetical protein
VSVADARPSGRGGGPDERRPRLAYAQARLQGAAVAASHGSGLAALASARTLPAYLEEARVTGLATGSGPSPDLSQSHELERGCRALARDAAVTVAEWAPASWRAAIEWVAWLPGCRCSSIWRAGRRLPDWVDDGRSAARPDRRGGVARSERHGRRRACRLCPRRRDPSADRGALASGVARALADLPGGCRRDLEGFSPADAAASGSPSGRDAAGLRVGAARGPARSSARHLHQHLLSPSHSSLPRDRLPGSRAVARCLAQSGALRPAGLAS